MPGERWVRRVNVFGRAVDAHAVASQVAVPTHWAASRTGRNDENRRGYAESHRGRGGDVRREREHQQRDAQGRGPCHGQYFARTKVSGIPLPLQVI